MSGGDDTVTASLTLTIGEQIARGVFGDGRDQRRQRGHQGGEHDHRVDGRCPSQRLWQVRGGVVTVGAGGIDRCHRPVPAEDRCRVGEDAQQ